MNGGTITHPVLRLAAAAMCALWTVSGWILVATQSFSTRPRRVTAATTVDGWGAVFVGGIFIALGLIALALLLRGRVVSQAARVALIGLWFVAPAALVLIW